MSLSSRHIQIIDGVVAGLIILLLPGIPTFAAAKMKLWPWPYIWGFCVVVLAFSIYLAEKYRSFRRRMPWTNRGLERRLHEWLLDPGFTITKVPDEKCLISFRTQDEQGRKVRITRSRAKDDRILLSGFLAVSPTDAGILNAASPDLVLGLIEDMRISMARLGVLFENIDTPLQRIALRRVVFVTDLNEVTFGEGVDLIRRALAICIEHVRRTVRLAGAQPTTSLEGPGESGAAEDDGDGH